MPHHHSASPPANARSGGALSQRTIELVQQSWAHVVPISDAAATIFYNRLFELDPSVRQLFKSDMGAQKKKLMQTLGVAVDGLNNTAKLIPVLRDLGVRHAGYMVQNHHYDLVGEALLWTLREGLGSNFTPEIERAWGEVYGLVAGIMMQAASSYAEDEIGNETLVTGNPPVTAEQAPGLDLSLGAARISPPPAGKSMPAKTVPDIPSLPDVLPVPRTKVGPPAAPRSTGQAAPNPLNPRMIELVQRSWAKVMPISDAAATLFYNRLFELDPSTRSLFKNDMSEQKKKLMQTLSVAVDGLNAPDKLIPVLQDLGVRHAGYMVQEHHYDLVGEALLWTLREGLGDEFTAEVASAWGDVYGLIAGVMKQAAGNANMPAANIGEAPSTARAARRAARPGEAETPRRVDRRAGRHEKRASPARIEARQVEPTPRAVMPASTPVPPAHATEATTAQVEISRSAVMPWNGQDGPVQVHLTLDPHSVQQLAPPPVQRPTGGFTLALLLSLICGVASMGAAAAMVLGFERPNGASGGQTATLLGLPIAVMIVTFAAFSLGYLLGNGRIAGPDTTQQTRR